ncbi:MAG: LysR family transcriptional regulator [Pseudomonadales bacterium]|nr:LysR family transcriptional regulator [Pseudomonadales bacterium]MDG1444248.1 LysR family transcriptional regulator [Pseudomonadales bacterium]
MNNLSQIRSMVALAHHGHFGRAANEIGLTQSALSQNIQRIELKYGVPLFTRGRGRVTLTAYGEVVERLARNMLESSAAAEREIASMQNLTSGSLVIGVDAFLNSALLSRVLSTILRSNPKLRFVLRTGHWDMYTTQLLNDEVDMYIGFAPPHPHSELEVEQVLVPSPVIVCGSEHPAKVSKVQSLAELVEYPVVSPFPPSWYVSWAQNQVERFRDRETVSSPNVLESDNIRVCKQLTKDNMTLTALLKADVRHELDRGELHVLEVEHWPVVMNSCIATKEGKRVSPAVDLVRDVYKKVAAQVVEENKRGKLSGSIQDPYVYQA